MLVPSVASQISHFYALGNTPAISLTRDLPRGLDANVLLVGCGDIRNIVYTAYTDAGSPPRSLDITCCDLDEGIIARNVLLLSLAIDHGKGLAKDTLWNIYSHLYLQEDELKIVSDQADKLLGASKSLKSWGSSRYGAVLPFCDEATRDDVRAVWSKYSVSADPSAREKYIFSFKADLQRSVDFRNKRFGHDAGDSSMSFTGLRSAAPLALQALDDIPNAFAHFWKTGVTGPKEATVPNPLIAAGVSENKTLHYGTDPVLGFHLASAFASLAKNSPAKYDVGREMFKSVAVAKGQLVEWFAATADLIKAKKLVVRTVVADVFSFCHALQHRAATGEASAGLYRRQFESRVLSLDASNMPSSFDVIDTSNLADHFGTLNLLISALPLLAPQPWATLSTETLLKGAGFSDKEALDKALCGHAPSVSLLLGVAPVEYWTNATSLSKIDEMIINLQLGSKKDTSQVQSRVSWKHDALFSGFKSSSPLTMAPDELANTLFHMYIKMFQHENTMSQVASMMANMNPSNSVLHSGYAHFHRGSFIALVKYLKAKFAKADFEKALLALSGMVASDESLAFASNYVQDFGAQTHLQGLWTAPWLKSQEGLNRSLGSIHTWQSVPEVVAVTLVVPRAQIDRLFDISPQAKLAAPTFAGALVSPSYHNMFGDVHLSFGTVSTNGSPDDDDFSVTINDDGGWGGSSPLVASFYMPARALQTDPTTCFVGLDVSATVQSTAIYRPALGEDMRISKARLDDRERVFVTKYTPGQSKYPIYCDAVTRRLSSGDEKADASATKATFTARGDEKSGKINNIVGHVDVVAKKGQKLLADKEPIELNQTSPFIIDIVFGKEALVLPVHFPVPVDGKCAKTRIARKSSYVEVIVPFANPSTDSSLADFIFPTTLASTSSAARQPVTLNTPHILLDRLPVLDVDKKKSLRWLSTLASFQFSVREKRLRDSGTDNSPAGLSTSPRLDFKESIFTIFMLATGLQGGQAGIFAINQPDHGRNHMLLLVSAVRLDPAAGSVVLDAAVLPLTDSLLGSGAIKGFLNVMKSLRVGSMKASGEEVALWKRALPALAERARDGWVHGKGCEYKKNASEGNNNNVPLSTVPGQAFLCSCGNGQLPKDFVAVPEWKTASKYATRVAISPTFAVPFVEDVVDMAAWEASGNSLGDSKERCSSCSAGQAKGGGTLKRCTRCREARYCSVECQKKDWKKHRAECEG